jgi:hypothetical protein
MMQRGFYAEPQLSPITTAMLILEYNPRVITLKPFAEAVSVIPDEERYGIWTQVGDLTPSQRLHLGEMLGNYDDSLRASFETRRFAKAKAAELAKKFEGQDPSLARKLFNCIEIKWKSIGVKFQNLQMTSEGYLL